MVIDKASQVRVPEAAVPISLAGRAGRLVLAGDHLQLPPIINGVYPEPLPGQPVLHRSIFELVAGPRGLRSPEDFRRLEDNGGLRISRSPAGGRERRQVLRPRAR